MEIDSLQNRLGESRNELTARDDNIRSLVAQLDEAIPVMELQLSDALRAACDALVPPGSAVVNFHNSAAWMRMQLNP